VERYQYSLLAISCACAPLESSGAHSSLTVATNARPLAAPLEEPRRPYRFRLGQLAVGEW